MLPSSFGLTTTPARQLTISSNARRPDQCRRGDAVHVEAVEAQPAVQLDILAELHRVERVKRDRFAGDVAEARVERDHAGIDVVRVGIEQGRGRIWRAAVLPLVVFVGEREPGDQRMLDRAGREARPQVGLIIEGPVFRDPRPQLAIDGRGIVVGEARRSGHRVARRIAEAQLVAQRQPNR